jgi:sugar phosphate isomerase/epimerase
MHDICKVVEGNVMRQWSLGQLTVIGTRPWELVEIAARAGYDAVDPLVGLVEFPGLPQVPLRKGHSDTIRMGEALRANGIAFHAADAFVLDPRTDLDAVARMIELVADLGAQKVVALIFGDDLAAGTAKLAALDEMANASGLGVVFEFAAVSAVANAEQAMEVIRQTGSQNIRLMLDTLHYSYAGGTPEGAKALAASIGAAQLCDAEAGLDYAAYAKTAAMERLAPGDGALDCGGFLAAFPADLMVSIEVPRPDEPDLVARARRMLDAARGLDEALPLNAPPF